MGKINGHLLHGINLSLKMLGFSVFCIIFFCCCAVEEIGFCPLAQQQDQIVCCSQVDLISASAHTAAPLPVEISFSLLLTQKRGERGVCTYANIKHTHTRTCTQT